MRSPRRTLVLVVAALAFASCTLRPRYAEFVNKESTGPVKLQLLEKSSGMPVAGALIEAGEFRGKLSVKTDADGYFLLPTDKKLIDENALLIVSPPAGVGRTQVVVASLAPVVLPEPVVTESMPLPTVESVDAGTGTGGRGD